MSAVATPARSRTAKNTPGKLREEREFIKGRDWAIKCLEEAQGLSEDGYEGTSRMRWMRGGKSQDNYVLGWVADAVGGPSALKNQALRGFCAVLSDYLGNAAGQMRPSAYAIPYAEFQAGEAGADGTEPVPRELLEEAAEPAFQAAAGAPPADTFASTAWYRAAEAEAVLRACAESEITEAAWGAVTVLDCANEILSRTHETPNAKDCQTVSNLYSQALAIIELIQVETADHLLDAGHTIIFLAKEILDAGREELHHA